MSDGFVPHEIAQFITEKIDSVAQLEALLLLHRGAEEQWTVQALANRLYIDEKQTAQVLSALCARGLVSTTAENPVRYHYEPNAPELRIMVDKLADIYSKRLVPITHLIHSKSRVQEFADAFKFRKDR